MTALITIAYNQPDLLRKLFITARQDVPITPFIFLHSKVSAVEGACDWVAAEYGGYLFKYKTNRGVARSWNDGIISAVEDGHEIIVITNDDLWFEEGDLKRLVNATINEPEYYAHTCGGFNRSLGTPVPDHGFSCFAVTSSILNTVGVFDQNFFPAYNEDVDFDLRAQKAGMSYKNVPGCNVQHIGSAAIATNPLLRSQNYLTHGENDAYFFRKWGINDDEDRSKAYKYPFANPNFHPYYIDPEEREDPYPGHGRAGFGIGLV